MLRKQGSVVFIIICAILGIILAIQFKTVVKTLGKGVNPRQRINQLTAERDKIREEEDRLRNELQDIEKQIKKYEESEKEKDESTKQLYDKLEKYKKFAGYEEVNGDGITIEINEPSIKAEQGQDYSIVIENYDLILQLISKLNDLRAKAIAINGQRYIDRTSLEPDSKRLKVNGVAVSLPLKIDVVGNPEEIQKGLKVKGNIMWNMEYVYLYNIKIKESNDITIPKVIDMDTFKYAKPSKATN